MDSPGPVLLVVGSGAQQYREYLLSSMARSHRLWLLNADEPTWQSRYLAGATVVDGYDVDALLKAARQVTATARVLGVVCYDEALILPAAHVVEDLGLPGMRVEAVRRCRDKTRTRDTLREAGVPQPVSIAVPSLAAARSAAAAIGYPVVLKPRALGASQGVIRVDAPGELERAFQSARGAAHPGVPTYEMGVLVEEYLDGPEVSIDGFTIDGEYHLLYIAHKEVGLAPYFEETGHVLAPHDPLFNDADLHGQLTLAHRALGVDRGITHTEVRFTRSGPRIVEVNGRLGGDLIPYLGLLSTGVDPGLVAAQIATGGIPPARPVQQRCLGIRFCYPPVDCEVTSIRLPEAVRARGVVAAVPLVTPGTVLRLPPRGYLSRFAHLICQADDLQTCRQRLETAASSVRLEHRPPAELDATPAANPQTPTAVGGGLREIR